jgi:hypothetical protein
MPLPTFIIAGERRCGTTSIYTWMSAHPQVFLHERSDENYFVEDEIGGRRWIEGAADAASWERSHDPAQYAQLFGPASGQSAIGHKGADLLYWRPAHERIARFAPGVKLIVSLRNPVGRAWSQYWNEVGKGREDASFDDARAEEDERCRRSDWASFHLAYVRRGFYEQSFEHLFRYIDRARVHVVTVEEQRKQPRESLQAIYRFLELDPERGLELAGQRVNENWTTVPRGWVKGPIKRVERGYARAVDAVARRVTRDPEKRRTLRKQGAWPFRRPASGIELPPATRDELRAIYAPHIRALEQLLGRSFAEWAR